MGLFFRCKRSGNKGDSLKDLIFSHFVKMKKVFDKIFLTFTKISDMMGLNDLRKRLNKL
ncbi:hypothetical protein DJ90_6451 [Paenibacillus macerans]|uniref:Uncharacterized protein n=1 Tax=Paenibacillus macerans TaxID=44252 RepID=A0A090ZK22_PAEMA|nr:hypothetical protein DJ90_6451 [Paenibacillus macerans]